MKKWVLFALICVLVFSMMACGRGDGAAGDRIHLRFAWATDNVDISQQGFFDVATEFANWLNKTRDDIFVELILFDGQASVDKQISDVETAMAMNVSGIILSAVDVDGVTPITLRAMREGFPVLDWRGMDGIATVSFINGNEHTKGQFLREWTRAYLIANPDVVFYAGLQQGSTNHPVTYPRMQYIYDLVTEMPGRFHVLVEASSDWSSGTSMRMVEDWLQVHRNMNFLASASEEQMLGAIEALRGGGVLQNFVTAAFNGEEPGVEMIERGELDLTVGVVMPLGMGLLVETAIRMVLDGFAGHIDISEQAMFNVDASNVAEYKQRIVVDYDNIRYFESTLRPSYR